MISYTIRALGASFVLLAAFAVSLYFWRFSWAALGGVALGLAVTWGLCWFACYLDSVDTELHSWGP